MVRLVAGLIFGFAGIFALGGAAVAQDLPAVSGLNGKLEFNAGLLSVPSPAFVGRAAGALTLPIGDDFGLQADVTAASAPGLTLGGALHVFTRDPSSHLLGGTIGVISTPGALILAAGPEAELYFDNISIEAWGGLSYARPTVGADRFLPFIMADIAYYPEPNWRLNLGLSALDGYGALHAGSEYLLDTFDLPVALTANARLGQDGAILATIGLRAYLGSPGKSLIDRHREDDPADRGASLFNSAGGVSIGGQSSTPPPKDSDPPPIYCVPPTILFEGQCVLP